MFPSLSVAGCAFGPSITETLHSSLDTGGRLWPGKHTWLKSDLIKMTRCILPLEPEGKPDTLLKQYKLASSTGAAVRKVPVNPYLIYYCFQFSCLPLCFMICHQLRETLRRFLYLIIYPNALFIEVFFSSFGWRLSHQNIPTVCFCFISFCLWAEVYNLKRIILLWKAVHI